MRALRLCSMLILAAAAAALLAACGDDSSSGSSGSDSGSTGESGSATSTVSLADCMGDGLQTRTPGTLTIATDKPAYPPYFEDDDPTNGKGFESAVGYAIAKQLGFQPGDVKWTVVPFNSSYAPGPKDFDFDLNQISITPKRAEQVDFSSTYYTADQAVVTLKDSQFAQVSSLTDLADAKIGVQIGTTSLDAATESISPSSEPQVFDNSNDVVSALKQGQVDAVVVDVPTAFYLTAVQVPEASIVGQFPAPGGDAWGALLQKGSPLTGCVSAAIDELQSSGELDQIKKRWISDATKAPVLG